MTSCNTARLTLEQAFQQLGCAAKHADDSLHAEDTSDPLLSWSIEQLHALTQGVRATSTVFQKEEGLFTGKSDLSSEYTTEELEGWVMVLNESSQQLAIVRALAIKHASDPGRSDPLKQVSEPSKLSVIMQTLTNRAAVDALNDSKLSELLNLDMLVQYVGTQHDASASTVISPERTHVNVTARKNDTEPSRTDAPDTVGALVEVTGLIEELREHMSDILAVRKNNVQTRADKQQAAALLLKEAIEIGPSIIQHVLRVGLGHGIQRNADVLIRNPSDTVVPPPTSIECVCPSPGHARYSVILTVEDADVPYNRSWDASDIAKVCSSRGHAQLRFGCGHTVGDVMMVPALAINMTRIEAEFRRVVESREATATAPITRILSLVDYKSMVVAHRQVDATRNRVLIQLALRTCQYYGIPRHMQAPSPPTEPPLGGKDGTAYPDNKTQRSESEDSWDHV